MSKDPSSTSEITDKKEGDRSKGGLVEEAMRSMGRGWEEKRDMSAATRQRVHPFWLGHRE